MHVYIAWFAEISPFIVAIVAIGWFAIIYDCETHRLDVGMTNPSQVEAHHHFELWLCVAVIITALAPILGKYIAYLWQGYSLVIYASCYFVAVGSAYRLLSSVERRVHGRSLSQIANSEKGDSVCLDTIQPE